MRFSLWPWIVLLAGSAVGWAADAPPAAPRAPIRSGCEFDYAPFCFVRDDGRADGFSVELMRAALAAMGREVDFKTGPWAQIKQELADGHLDALPMVARSPQREALFDFTFPYYTMHGTIVVRADDTAIRGPDDLRGKQVAVLQGDVAHEYLRGADLGAVIVPLSSYATAMRGLSAGTYDAVVIQKLLALQLMKQLGLTNLHTVGPPLAGYNQVFCFAVREGDTELLSLLNEGLAIVMADGTFRQLHAKWFASLEEERRTRSRIVVGGDANFPPYEFLDANGQPAGYNVDLTRAIARQMGLSVDIRLAPWAEVREGLDRGEIDIVHGMFYSEERDGQFDFSGPHALVQHVIVVRQGSPPLSDLQALAGKSVLVMRGDITHDQLLQYARPAAVVAVDSEEEALRRLAAGDGDCALVARLPALYWIEKNGWRNLVISSKPFLSAEYCYAVPEGADALLAEFTEGLAAVKQTGQYREIQARWLAPYEATEIGLRQIAQYALLGAVPLLVLLAGALLWTRSLQAQVRRRTRQLQTETEFLRLIGQRKTKADIVRAAAKFLQELSGCEAVGVRLKEGEDYPYCEIRGFPGEFVEAENYLCARDAQGELVREADGRAALHCMCGNVISGRTDPRQPFFTPAGSFWTNSTTELLASTSEADRLARTRNRCNQAGYESVALVPLWTGSHRLGLIQFNDRRPGVFTADDISLWERLAGALAVAVAKTAAEEAHRRSELRYRQLLRVLPAAMYTCDAEGSITYYNEQAALIWRREPQLGGTDERFCGAFRLFDVDGSPVAHADSPMAVALRDGSDFRGQEIVIERPDGTRVSVSMNIDPLRDDAGRICGAINVFTDVTERKRAEERIRASLAEKEVLLKEVHHRVKNNMQVVSSLVSLQAGQLHDPAMRAVLEEVTHRVRSMALVHEKLYQSADMARVEFASYAESLLNYLWRAHGAAATGIRLVPQFEAMQLSINVAVPCGLILNELVSNALKHAFRGKPASRNGSEVAVSLCGGIEGRACLRVRDNGAGLPPGFDWQQADTLGLRLVQILAAQIRATVEVRSGEGTEFTVTLETPTP